MRSLNRVLRTLADYRFAPAYKPRGSSPVAESPTFNKPENISQHLSYRLGCCQCQTHLSGRSLGLLSTPSQPINKPISTPITRMILMTRYKPNKLRRATRA